MCVCVSYTVQGETVKLTYDNGPATKPAGSSFYSEQLTMGLYQEVNLGYLASLSPLNISDPGLLVSVNSGFLDRRQSS